MDALLWSINDVLRGGEGLDVPVLTDEWMNELGWLIELDAERERKRKKKRKPGSAFSMDDDDDED